MPFLRDEGPPIPAASIQKYRESLPLDYGWQSVNETGREVLVVRVPKAKPDYLHDLSEVAFYVGLDTIRNAKDVLLIGHEKTARLEPQLLRDHIRSQGREDTGVVDGLRRSLDRQYGHTFVQSPSNFSHRAFAVRIPKDTVAQFSPDDVNAIRQVIESLRARIAECQYAYVVANGDYERLGKRVLMELMGMSEAPMGAAPAPAAVDIAAPAPAPATPSARTPFPSAHPSPPQPAVAAPPAFVPQPIMAAPPVAASQVSWPSPVEIAVHDEYEIVSKPRAVPAPEAPVAPPALGLADATQVHEEYEIVAKPRAPPMAAAPLPSASPASEPAQGKHVLHADSEFEVFTSTRAPATEAAPAAMEESPATPGEGKHVLHADKEFEVFTSKPKPRVEGPAITPPGMGGFQAALGAAKATAHPPARTREYEIIGRTSVVSDESIGARMRLPSATPGAAPAMGATALPRPMEAAFAPAAPPPAPMTQSTMALPRIHFPTAAPAAPVVEAPALLAPPVMPSAPVAPLEPAPTQAPALPPRVAVTSLPAADNGATIIARVAPAAPELILAQRFRETGYEVVEGLRAQGTIFAFAAHRPNGRRVLVKRASEFGPEDAAALAQLVAALGADVALVVSDAVKPGTRLATWGTRIEVVTPLDVPSLVF